MAERQRFIIGAEKVRVSGGGGIGARGSARRVSPNDHFPQHAVDVDGYTLCRSIRWPAATTFAEIDWEDSAPQARCPDCMLEYKVLDTPTI